MPTIRVPDLGKPPARDEEEENSSDLGYQEYEVSQKQADRWNRMNEKDQLTLVLRADREGKDVRDLL